METLRLAASILLMKLLVRPEAVATCCWVQPRALRNRATLSARMKRSAARGARRGRLVGEEALTRHLAELGSTWDAPLAAPREGPKRGVHRIAQIALIDLSRCPSSACLGRVRPEPDAQCGGQRSCVAELRQCGIQKFGRRLAHGVAQAEKDIERGLAQAAFE